MSLDSEQRILARQFDRVIMDFCHRLSVLIDEFRMEFMPDSAGQSEFAKYILETALKNRTQLEVIFDQVPEPFEKMARRFIELSVNLANIAQNAADTEPKAWMTEEAPLALKQILAEAEFLRHSLQQKLAEAPAQPSQTPVGDSELVLEFTVPENVTDSELLSEILQASMHADALHRTLGGHGLTIRHLDIFDESRVPEVQRG